VGSNEIIAIYSCIEELEMTAMHFTFRAAFFSLLLFCWQAARAQQSEVTSQTPQDDLTALKEAAKNIGEQQRQIISSLNEIKQLLANKLDVLHPAAQPPGPPSALAIHDQSFRGKSDASVAIIEYADFECPYCGQYEHDIYPQISKDYIQTGKAKYFFRDLPLPMHPHAMIAARATRCAGEQGKYWEMHDSLFAKQNAIREADMPGRAKELGLDSAKFSECLSSNRYVDDINRSAVEAQNMGIEGTPTFFVGKLDSTGGVTNLKPIVGARPYEAFKSVIDGLLADGTVPGSGHLDGK
jgi:protein-disulfide isomerase